MRVMNALLGGSFTMNAVMMYYARDVVGGAGYFTLLFVLQTVGTILIASVISTLIFRGVMGDLPRFVPLPGGRKGNGVPIWVWALSGGIGLLILGFLTARLLRR